jgi:hypothetical protein
LIVAGMPGRDLTAVVFAGELVQGSITQLPGSSFDVCPASQLGTESAANEGHLQPLRCGRRARLVCVGVGTAQAMMHVRGEQADPKSRPQPGQDGQQADGVGAAGNGDQYAFPGCHHVVPAHAPKNRPEKSRKRMLHNTFSVAGSSPVYNLAERAGGPNVRYARRRLTE